MRLHYRYRGSGKRGFQTVHPYGFLYGNRHYLVARSELAPARDFRSFALARTERVEGGHQHQSPPSDLGGPKRPSPLSLVEL